MGTTVYFVESLTLWMWAWSICPRLVWRRLGGGPKVTHCYVFDASALPLLVAKASAWAAGVLVERLSFRIEDVRDQDGWLSKLRVIYGELAEVQRQVTLEPVFQQALEGEPLAPRLPIFLAKNVVIVGHSDGDIMERVLLKVRICTWKIRQEPVQHTALVLFLERRPWLGAIENYAAENGVTIVAVPSPFRLVPFLRRRLPPQIIDLLRALRYRRSLRSRISTIDDSTHFPDVPGVGEGENGLAVEKREAGPNAGPRIAVEIYGQLNLDSPELNSDLFFWQQSAISGRDLLLSFFLPQAPLDEAALSELHAHGMKAVALNEGATTVPGVPVFTKGAVRSQIKNSSHVTGEGQDATWARDQLARYHSSRSYWTRVFQETGTKIYVTWHFSDASHCAVADALQDLGGVTALYQRSYDSHPSPSVAIGADIVFGFSPQFAEIYQSSDSAVGYHVATGYVGDHRFPLLREGARKIKSELEQNGARHILAYFDENSSDDGRWRPGHASTQESYAYLLEKVLNEPWFGLVLKPKIPRTLRRRLGPVTSLLDQALATGRCYFFQSGAFYGTYPPAGAALAADVAVHDNLRSATAGLEAALAGVPTLLLDEERWPASPLYRLGEGRVVFTEWEDIWEACSQFWTGPEGRPGFGDWSPMLDELDPFRDGRAAERIGTYLQWMIEGFRAGLDRETVMADAADRYAENWGSDKITRLDLKPRDSEPSIAYMASDDHVCLHPQI